MIGWQTSPEFMRDEELIHAYRQAVDDKKVHWAAELMREVERRGLEV